jgi:dTMP kinase
MSEYTGTFITFEGGEGSGKTTVINRIGERLTADGYKVVTTREPGGTPQGERVRSLIVQGEIDSWSPLEEVLLIFAARHAHVAQVIYPALRDGKIVLCDRFTDSTRAYQGYGHGLDLALIESVNDLILNGFSPDLTFVLDVDPRIGVERSKRHLATESFGIESLEDRYEHMDLSFHDRLRAGFLDIAQKSPDRCHVIEDKQSIDDVSAQVFEILQTKMKKSK